MIAKYREGVVPEGPETTLDQAGREAVAGYIEAMEATDLRGAAEAAWRLVTAANQYIVQTAPWTLAKNGAEAELDRALGALARCLYRLAVLATPFMPGKSEELWQFLGQSGAPGSLAWASLDTPRLGGCATRRPAGLFPRPEQPPTD
jgi:methionyl-tRNA synthetase